MTRCKFLFGPQDGYRIDVSDDLRHVYMPTRPIMAAGFDWRKDAAYYAEYTRISPSEFAFAGYMEQIPYA